MIKKYTINLPGGKCVPASKSTLNRIGYWRHRKRPHYLKIMSEVCGTGLEILGSLWYQQVLQTWLFFFSLLKRPNTFFFFFRECPHLYTFFFFSGAQTLLVHNFVYTVRVLTTSVLMEPPGRDLSIGTGFVKSQPLLTKLWTNKVWVLNKFGHFCIWFFRTHSGTYFFLLLFLFTSRLVQEGTREESYGH